MGKKKSPPNETQNKNSDKKPSSFHTTNHTRYKKKKRGVSRDHGFHQWKRVWDNASKKTNHNKKQRGRGRGNQQQGGTGGEVNQQQGGTGKQQQGGTGKQQQGGTRGKQQQGGTRGKQQQGGTGGKQQQGGTGGKQQQVGTGGEVMQQQVGTGGEVIEQQRTKTKEIQHIENESFDIEEFQYNENGINTVGETQHVEDRVIPVEDEISNIEERDDEGDVYEQLYDQLYDPSSSNDNGENGPVREKVKVRFPFIQGIEGTTIEDLDKRFISRYQTDIGRNVVEYSEEDYEFIRQKDQSLTYVKPDLSESIPAEKYPLYIGMTKEAFETLFKIITSHSVLQPRGIPSLSEWKCDQVDQAFREEVPLRSLKRKDTFFIVLSLLTTGFNNIQLFEFLGLGQILSERTTIDGKRRSQGRTSYSKGAMSDFIGGQIDYFYDDFSDKLYKLFVQTIRTTKEFNLPFAYGCSDSIVRNFPQLLNTYSAIDSKSHESQTMYCRTQKQDQTTVKTKNRKFFSPKTAGSAWKVQVEVNYFGLAIDISDPMEASIHDNKVFKLLVPRDEPDEPIYVLGDLGYRSSGRKEVIVPIQDPSKGKQAEKRKETTEEKEKRIYLNKIHSTQRNRVENFFGRLVTRYRFFLKKSNLQYMRYRKLLKIAYCLINYDILCHPLRKGLYITADDFLGVEKELMDKRDEYSKYFEEKNVAKMEECMKEIEELENRYLNENKLNESEIKKIDKEIREYKEKFDKIRRQTAEIKQKQDKENKYRFNSVLGYNRDVLIELIDSIKMNDLLGERKMKIAIDLLKKITSHQNTSKYQIMDLNFLDECIDLDQEHRTDKIRSTITMQMILNKGCIIFPRRDDREWKMYLLFLGSVPFKNKKHQILQDDFMKNYHFIIELSNGETNSELEMKDTNIMIQCFQYAKNCSISPETLPESMEIFRYQWGEIDHNKLSSSFHFLHYIKDIFLRSPQNFKDLLEIIQSVHSLTSFTQWFHHQLSLLTLSGDSSSGMEGNTQMSIFKRKSIIPSISNPLEQSLHDQE